MKKTGEFLRLRHSLGLTMEEVAAAMQTSKATVSNVLKRADAASLSWPLPDGMTNDALQALIYPRSEATDGGRLAPDWAAISDELNRKERRRARVTRLQLWEEYRDEAEAAGLKAYGRSRFFELLASYRAESNFEMRFDYLPGDYAMSDFSGKTLPLSTPEGVVDVEIFVCVLNYSQLIFAIALEDQTLPSWVRGHEAAFRYYGGVSSKLVIDNLKPGVTRWDRFDPALNPSFAEFARHYNVAVLPARPRSARDKGAVEQAVKVIQSRVLVPLRKTQFMTLAEMNIAILKQLDRLNASVMAKYRTSRRERFEAGEKSQLQPLPQTRWEYAESKKAKVGPDSHVQFQLCRYSVPWEHIGNEVWLRYTRQTVEVLSVNGDSIATHRRRTGRNQYSTCPDHLPESYREMKRRHAPDHQIWLITTLTGFGDHAALWAQRCLEDRDFPPQAYATLRGAIALGKKWGPSAVNDACLMALDRGNFTSGFLRDHFKTMASKPDDDPIPDHPNIRGSAYYSDKPESPSWS